MKIVLVVLMLVCVALGLGTNSTLGVDVNVPTTSAEFKCLNASFVIVRGYLKEGLPDEHAPQTIAAAWNAGVPSVSVLMNPCFSCGGPKEQVQDLLESLSGSRFDYIFIDVTQDETDWGTNVAENTLFMLALAQEIVNQHFIPGIKTSKADWLPITGSTQTMKQYPLWNIQFGPQNQPFIPFSGWTKQQYLQFAPNMKSCGIEYNLNVEPGQ
eukprot:TRINITY_DN28363_c0_g1_i1.p1 TRINITY_DN28363_c0_g1~~TRINITY_DN28363_c0_g1_i1.p1  ORF type:complete len:219 (-),score=54.21 TRINITY_DN28363_c0_g1_i1:46-681(-)